MIGRGVCIYVLACKGEKEGKWYIQIFRYERKRRGNRRHFPSQDVIYSSINAKSSGELTIG